MEWNCFLLHFFKLKEPFKSSRFQAFYCLWFIVYLSRETGQMSPEPVAAVPEFSHVCCGSCPPSCGHEVIRQRKKCQSIHPSIHCLYPLNRSVGSQGGWSLSQWSSGERRGRKKCLGANPFLLSFFCFVKLRSSLLRI